MIFKLNPGLEDKGQSIFAYEEDNQVFSYNVAPLMTISSQDQSVRFVNGENSDEAEPGSILAPLYPICVHLGELGQLKQNIVSFDEKGQKVQQKSQDEKA
mmetsp:Transcript_6917/g.6189  ORF Transcript_6917/g.6189 Transcript_6917/m.6189 type:complete len:100 (+) Transcript_6917:541-840(+)